MSAIDLPQDTPARAYIRRVMDKTKLDATNLARRSGLNPSTLTRFMGDNPRSESLSRRSLEDIARFSGVPLPASLVQAASDAPVQMSIAGAMALDVPVHALVAAPADGSYYWNQTTIDVAPRLPGIARAARAFALRMPDETMEGWRRVNEMIYVDPMRAVAEGDHALVEIANTGAPDNPSLYRIRRVLRRRPDGVVLGSWGEDPAREQLTRANVLSFHRILEWPELLGC